MPFKSLHTIRKKFITIVLLYVGLFSIKAQVQEPSLLTLQNTTETTGSEIARLTEFVKNAEVFNYLYPQEKVYLHFDNSGYFGGETIWFKAYVVNSTTNKYTDLSKVLYVELLSPEGRILDTQKLKIEDGQCNGQFLLTKIIHAGFYEIRAYTRMMLNWDSELIYSRVFPVFNAPQKEEADMYKSPKMSRLPYSQRLPNQRIKASHLEDINLSFFPEGGSLIEGITSTVSFKANDKQGNALDVSGTIYNKQKEAITAFDTYYNGMGKFDFTPVKGEKYKAEIILNEKTYSFDLPSALSLGVVLSMNTMRNYK